MLALKTERLDGQCGECEWEGCAEEATHRCLDTEGTVWTRLCPEHVAKIELAICRAQAGSAGPLLSAWVKANGGAAAMTRRMTNG